MCDVDFVTQIARVCHQANKAYCESMNDFSIPSWSEAPEDQKNSIIAGVKMHLNDRTLSPSSSHEAWYKHKEAEGWKYAPIKNVELKEHPCMVPYDQLPQQQKSKDFIFKAIVLALSE